MKYRLLLPGILIFIITLVSCTPAVNTAEPVPEYKSRLNSIPSNAVKVRPDDDNFPPQVVSPDYNSAVPLGSGINTAGAEDSAFILPDGNTMYFFFTPDVSVPPEKQLVDGATGIYYSVKQDNRWLAAKRLILNDKNEVSLDGCIFVQDDTIWFCSARKGNYRGVDFWIAHNNEGNWTWENAGEKLNSEYEIGEMHITADGKELYFHWDKPGGKGGLDIWKVERINGDWGEPVNVAAVNSAENEGWPFITRDGSEMWFNRTYMGTPGIYRSKKTDNDWGEPELIISQFAGEPTLDNAGNIYFTHHFYEDGKMIEADIYAVYRK
jgi:hypothetical protein